MTLVLKRASASRPSGEWNDDDYDVLAEGIVVGRIMNAAACAGGHVMVVDARVRIPRGPHPDARLRGDARGRDGRVRQELAAGVVLRSGGRSAVWGKLSFSGFEAGRGTQSRH